MTSAILAIDQGTTSSRAIMFAADLSSRGMAQQEIAQHYPASGHVEHDPEEIWSTTLATARGAMQRAELGASDVAAIGITNQRETTILWDRRTGRPIHRALVWQDRRTAPLCRRLAEDGLEPILAARTGLRLDPYFSASKIAWLLDNVDGARAAAEAGHIAFGTVDTWLLHKLTGGRVHATDATNAARTALLDIHTGTWDETLLEAFAIPRSVLPEVRDCNADFGVSEPALLGGAIAIRGIAGDQQAATMGQACFRPGMMKATYGTGCFALLNTGSEAVASGQKLLTTIAYQLDGRRTYALEGAIFIAGAAVQWLRDGLHLITTAAETGPLAAAADPSQQVVFVPAFVGLGAPYWHPEARGALFGLTRATGARELARSVLDATAFQTRDLLEAMRADWRGAVDGVLRVDGGMVASDQVLQSLSDALAAPVERPTVLETTALGAAWLAGWRAGVLPDMDGFSDLWRLDRRFEPLLGEPDRAAAYRRWKRAVAAVIAFAEESN
ncbi:MAG: glycerol kinase GlpK [Hyphomicrobiaceae bacterium]|nr:glycerol kinase GlpK [Hyphomicrobiaceae bacterium]